MIAVNSEVKKVESGEYPATVNKRKKLLTIEIDDAVCDGNFPGGVGEGSAGFHGVPSGKNSNKKVKNFIEYNKNLARGGVAHGREEKDYSSIRLERVSVRENSIFDGAKNDRHKSYSRIADSSETNLQPSRAKEKRPSSTSIQEENAGQRKPWERKLPNTPEVKSGKTKEIYIPVHLSTKFVSSNGPAHQIPGKGTGKGGFLTSKGQLFRRSPPKRNKGPLLASQQQQSNLQTSKKALEIPSKKNSDDTLAPPPPTSNSQHPKPSPRSGVKVSNSFTNDKNNNISPGLTKGRPVSPGLTKPRPIPDRTGSTSKLSPSRSQPKSNPQISLPKEPHPIPRKTSNTTLLTITEKISPRKPDPKKPLLSKRGSRASIALNSAHSNKSLSRDKIIKLSPSNISSTKKFMKNFVVEEGDGRGDSPCFFFNRKSEDEGVEHDMSLDTEVGKLPKSIYQYGISGELAGSSGRNLYGGQGGSAGSYGKGGCGIGQHVGLEVGGGGGSGGRGNNFLELGSGKGQVERIERIESREKGSPGLKGNFLTKPRMSPRDNRDEGEF